MPSDYQKIVSAMARRMRTVSGIGHVHEGRMFTESPDEFRALHFCQSQRRIHSWTVTRESFSDEQVETGHAHERLHRFRIRGFLSLLNDINSDLQFNRLIDGVSAALDDDGDLDLHCEIQFPVQCERITVAFFGEMLCHYCELTVDVREYFTSVSE